MTSAGEPPPPALRRIADIDVASVAEALDDASADMRWWYDPATGQVEPGLPDDFMGDLDDEDDHEEGMVLIESPGSRAAYEDMVDFANAVGDLRASELLTQALHGRGAFRRFRDTLAAFDDLSDRWFDYRRAAGERRAIDWLVEENLLTGDDIDIERDRRWATMSAVLEQLAGHHDHTVAEADLIDRWDEITDLIDQGQAITITRDGRAWASIRSAARPGPRASRRH